MGARLIYEMWGLMVASPVGIVCSAMATTGRHSRTDLASWTSVWPWGVMTPPPSLPYVALDVDSNPWRGVTEAPRDHLVNPLPALDSLTFSLPSLVQKLNSQRHTRFWLQNWPVGYRPIKWWSRSRATQCILDRRAIDRSVL